MFYRKKRVALADRGVRGLSSPCPADCAGSTSGPACCRQKSAVSRNTCERQRSPHIPLSNELSGDCRSFDPLSSWIRANPDPTPARLHRPRVFCSGAVSSHWTSPRRRPAIVLPCGNVGSPLGARGQVHGHVCVQALAFTRAFTRSPLFTPFVNSSVSRCSV